MGGDDAGGGAVLAVDYWARLAMLCLSSGCHPDCCWPPTGLVSPGSDMNVLITFLFFLFKRVQPWIDNQNGHARMITLNLSLTLTNRKCMDRFDNHCKSTHPLRINQAE